MGLLEDALILLAGMLIGRFAAARHKGPKPVRQPEPVCGCSHHYAYHDPKTGECGHAERLVLYRDVFSTTYGDTVRCPCKQYSGPVPLPEYVATEIAGGSGA